MTIMFFLALLELSCFFLGFPNKSLAPFSLHPFYFLVNLFGDHLIHKTRSFGGERERYLEGGPIVDRQHEASRIACGRTDSQAAEGLNSPGGLPKRGFSQPHHSILGVVVQEVGGKQHQGMVHGLGDLPSSENKHQNHLICTNQD